MLSGFSFCYWQQTFFFFFPLCFAHSELMGGDIISELTLLEDSITKDQSKHKNICKKKKVADIWRSKTSLVLLAKRDDFWNVMFILKASRDINNNYGVLGDHAKGLSSIKKKSSFSLIRRGRKKVHGDFFERFSHPNQNFSFCTSQKQTTFFIYLFLCSKDSCLMWIVVVENGKVGVFQQFQFWPIYHYKFSIFWKIFADIFVNWCFSLNPGKWWLKII